MDATLKSQGTLDIHAECTSDICEGSLPHPELEKMWRSIPIVASNVQSSRRLSEAVLSGYISVFIGPSFHTILLAQVQRQSGSAACPCCIWASLRAEYQAQRAQRGCLGAAGLQQASVDQQTSAASQLQMPPQEQAAQEQACTPACSLPKAGEAFSWTKHWYAVAAADDVEKDRPYAFTLLGQPLVIWHDGSEWRCAEDRCPHRAAPLSEGKASSIEAEASTCANRRSCATMRPIRECMSLLFVWGESGPGAMAEAAAAQPPLLDKWEGQQAAGVRIKTLVKPYHRDLPYDYQMLIKNVVDPAHVPFSHHGVMGNRRVDKMKHGMYDMRRLESESQTFLAGPVSIFDQLEFLPPSTIAYMRTKPDDDMWGCFIFFATPTTPGRCRFVAQSVSTYANDPLPLFIASLFPRWYDHVMTRHKILDGDSVFLHLQEHKLVDEARQLEAEASASGSNDSSASTPDTAAAAACAWQRLYFMPAAADVLVAAFKSWLDSKGGGGPFGPLHRLGANAYPPRVADRRVLLDRWQAHTVTCASCRRAFDFISKLRVAAAAAAAVALGAALHGVLSAAASGGLAAAAGGAAPLPALATVLAPAAWAAAAGAALGLVWRFLGSLRDKFIFEDYVHATR
eukprot:scaffold2.g7123.t1